MNQLAQQQLNPEGTEMFYELEGLSYPTELREGDPVICKANLYQDKYDLRNGSMGKIIKIYDSVKTFEIKKSKKSKQMMKVSSYGLILWDDGGAGYETEIPLEVIQSIQLAYGITVHKAQGSQFENAIFAVAKSPNLERTLVYTALTRASKRVAILGDIKSVNNAIVNPSSASNRYVGLGDFLDEVCGFS